MRKTKIFITSVALLIFTGCASLPTRSNPDVDKVRILAKVIEKQTDAIVTMVTGKKPEPTPEPTPDSDKDYGTEPTTLIAKRIR